MKSTAERLVFYINERKRLLQALHFVTIEEIDGDIEKYTLFLKILDEEYKDIKEKYPEMFI